MATTMRHPSIHVLRAASRLAFAAVACATILVADVRAQSTADSGPSRWRIGAATGAYVPFSALIRAADADDTHLRAGPAFSLESQYQVLDPISLYANGLVAFGTIRLGSSIRPAVVGPSDQVMLMGGTAGVMLAPDGWLGPHVQPTLRLGGGVKWYSFDLTDAESRIRPTADIGIGFRGVGIGAIEVMAEVRYLPSSFDQGMLPTRGIAVQDQHQNDIAFSIGVAIRRPG